MKKDNRTSRYYDLRENQGLYKGPKNLVGWWKFSEKDTGKSAFTDKTGLLSGSFVGAQPNVGNGPVTKMPVASFESPSFLKGDQFLRDASVTIDSRGSAHSFEVSNFPAAVPLDASSNADGATISMTFKLLQHYPQPVGATDGKVELLSICTDTLTDGKLALWYDNDGLSSEPALMLALKPDNAGSTPATWVSTTPSTPGNPLKWYDTIDDLRGWLRLDFVIYNMTYSTGAFTFNDWPNRGIGGSVLNRGLKIFVNGKQVLFANRTATGDGTYQGSNLEKVLFGSLPFGITDPNPPSTNNSMKLGECAIWNRALSDSEISYLYACTRESRNSGVISAPAKTQITCAGDAYPTVNRSTDSRRLGKQTPSFDDASTLAIPSVGATINYPTLVTSGADAAGMVGTVISDPHSLPTLYATQPVEGMQGRANIITGYSREKKNFSDSFQPFNDSAAPVELATRIGHLSEIVPGWSSNAGDRIIIDIDVTPSETKVLAVITGSNGQTFGNIQTKPDEDKTGLAYFNFTTAKFESIGGRNSETGNRIAWCLPGQVSSSQHFNSLWNDAFRNGDAAGTPFVMGLYELGITVPGFTAGSGYPANAAFYGALTLEDFTKVPRIFQPYSSIVSHRTTFNQVFAGRFNPFDYSIGRRYGYQSPDAEGVDLHAAISTLGGVEIVDPPAAGPKDDDTKGFPFDSKELNQTPSGSFYLGEFFSRISANQATGIQGQMPGGGRALSPPATQGQLVHRTIASARRCSLVWGGFGPTYFDDTNNGTGNSSTEVISQTIIAFPIQGRGSRGAGEWTPFTNDILGVSWMMLEAGTAFDSGFVFDMERVYTTGTGFKRIWNESTAPAPYDQSEVLTEEFNSTYQTMGRPVAYTNWCRNSMFHASSSQGLLMSDFIDVPMVLESFDIQASVNAKRLHQPMSGTAADTSAADEIFKSNTSRQLVWWSNTNNHIDMLTFFLLKQSDSVAGYKTGAVKSAESVRELVGFSNHIFASPYVGWDWANRIHLTKDPLGLLGVDTTQPAHKYFPRRQAPGEDSYYGASGPGNASPMGGARATRVFEVRKADVIKNVPGVDSFTYYKNPDGTDITEEGAGGVFFAAHRGTLPDPYTSDPGYLSASRGKEWLSNGVPNAPAEITANVPGDLTHQPMRRFVTASTRIDINVPVRAAGAYYQKSTPILPMCQSTMFAQSPNEYGSNAFKVRSYFVHSGSFGISDNRGDRGTGVAGTGGGTDPLAPVGRFSSILGNGLHGWVAPLLSLPTMGTFWPGGSKTSQVKIAKNIEFLSSSVYGFGTKGANDLTIPMSSLKFSVSQSDTGVSNVPFTYASVASQLADVWAPSPRLLINHSGSAVNPLGQVGGRMVGTVRTISPAVGRSYNPSFDKPPHSYSRLNYPQGNEYPGYLSNDFSGSDHAQPAGYILEPKDRLIFGTQWSPADAVHRSMMSIRHESQRLKYIGTNEVEPGVYAVTGTLPGPREVDGNWVFNSDLRDNCLAEIGHRGQLSPEMMGSQYYRWAGFCESNDLAMMASASCEILAEPMRLRLYGTLLREQRQQQHSLPQQLTTNCVHEVVGNEPVVDQYSLAERSDYQTNSSLGVQISGSLLLTGYTAVQSDRKSFTGDPADTTWGTVSDQLNIIARGKRRKLINDGTFRDIFAIKRTLRLADVSEFYYDSLTPDVERCFAVDGCGFNYDLRPSDMSVATQLFTDSSATDAEVSGRGNIPSVGGVISYGSANGSEWKTGTNSNRVWSRSFPFEPKYSGVQRLFRQSVAPPGAHFILDELPLCYSASTMTGPSGPGDMRNGSGTAGGNNVFVSPGLSGGSATGGPQLNKSTSQGPVPGGVYKLATEKILRPNTEVTRSIGKSGTPAGTPVGRADFHHGSNPHTEKGLVAAARTYMYANFNISGSAKNSLDGYFGIGSESPNVSHYGSIYLGCQFATLGSSGDRFLDDCALLSQKPRGYKYGLLSSTPKTLSAVYRNNRYGQFRDMLEQRKFSALFINDPEDITNDRINSGRRTRKSVVEEPAVTARFRTPAFQDPTAPAQNVQAKPVDTNCSNLNNAMTSSLPYFDGVLRNRDSAPTTDTDVIVI